MTTVLLSLVAIAVAIAAMSIGVMLGRPPISGSCGGVGGRCAACSGTCPSKRTGAEPSTSGSTR